MKRIYIVLFIIGILLIDQISKILVKTNMPLFESIMVFGEWFQIRFVENPGAAFGFELGGNYGKLILSIVRLVAIGALIYYINHLWKHKAPTGVILGFSAILAGAFGNVVDSAFYGLIFSESTYTTVATIFPAGGGYGTFLHGSVVDMLYFPIIESTWPDWMPVVGGREFTFFSPVFNLADSSVFSGVAYLIIFQRKYFK